VKGLARPAFLFAFVLASLVAPVAHAAPGPVLSPLLTRDLPEYPGKQLHSFTVAYPPGGSDPVHRHEAHAFVYVLEGSVVMAVRGQKEVTLTKGQAWYESPGDVHTVSRNASSTQPARFLVVFLKDKGADDVIPAR
jgi:quercetin dioxygenase-like cupin family protein